MTNPAPLRSTRCPDVETSQRWSARGECEHGPALPGLVLGKGQIAVEHPAERVAGEVLQDGIDHEVVRSGCPSFPRCQLPRSLFASDLPYAVDAPTVWTDNAQAASEQAVVEWSLEHDVQWLEGVARRDGQDPAVGLDAATFLATDLVPPLGTGSEGEPEGIAEPLVDHQPE